MAFKSFRNKAGWLALISGVLFLSVSSYLHYKFVFESGRWAGMLEFAALISAIFTLLFGVASFPRWQSFVAFAICAYAVYWFTTPPYALS